MYRAENVPIAVCCSTNPAWLTHCAPLSSIPLIRQGYYVTVKNTDREAKAEEDDLSWRVPYSAVLPACLNKKEGGNKYKMLDEQNVTCEGVPCDALELLKETRETYEDFDYEIENKITDYMFQSELDKVALKKKKKKREADAPSQQPPAAKTPKKPTENSGTGTGLVMKLPPFYPAQSSLPAEDEGAQEVRMYLTKIRLDKCADILINDLGYDDLAVLQTKVDLVKLETQLLKKSMKVGHIEKLLIALKEYRGLGTAHALPPTVDTDLAADPKPMSGREITTPVNLAAAGSLLSSPRGSTTGLSVKTDPPDSSSASQPSTTVSSVAIVALAALEDPCAPREVAPPDPLGLEKVSFAAL